MKPLKMGTHLRVLSESYLMNTNMTGIGWLSILFCTHVLRTKEALALEGLIFPLTRIDYSGTNYYMPLIVYV